VTQCLCWQVPVCGDGEWSSQGQEEPAGRQAGRARGWILPQQLGNNPLPALSGAIRRRSNSTIRHGSSNRWSDQSAACSCCCSLLCLAWSIHSVRTRTACQDALLVAKGFGLWWCAWRARLRSKTQLDRNNENSASVLTDSVGPFWGQFVRAAPCMRVSID